MFSYTNIIILNVVFVQFFGLKYDITLECKFNNGNIDNNDNNDNILAEVISDAGVELKQDSN